MGTCHAGAGHGPARDLGSSGFLCDACHHHVLHLQRVQAAQEDLRRRGFKDYDYEGRYPATAVVDKQGSVLALILGLDRQFLGGARLAGWSS